MYGDALTISAIDINITVKTQFQKIITEGAGWPVFFMKQKIIDEVDGVGDFEYLLEILLTKNHPEHPVFSLFKEMKSKARCRSCTV